VASWRRGVDRDGYLDITAAFGGPFVATMFSPR
jgi:hypothetical protein